MSTPPDSESVGLERQIASVKREIAMRMGSYPKWVAQGRMKQAAADMEIRAMQAVLATLHDMKLLRGDDNPDIGD